MSKHTKGPWALSTRTGKPSNEICGSDAICIVKSDGPMTGYIAHMVASGHYSKKLANARLIAAAPETKTQRDDLLLAMKYIRDKAEDEKADPRFLLRLIQEMAQETIVKIAAIAKATG